MNPEDRNICLHYIVAVSIGAVSQPTAVAVIEQETRVRGDWRTQCTALRLRHLERVPIDLRYPKMVDHVDGLIERMKEHEGAEPTDLVVDVTGTSRSVGELIKDSGLEPINVTITAGSGESEPKWREHRVSKAELVGNLQVAYQTDRLKMAEGLELVPTLVKELQTFKMRSPTINETDPESWREGQYDDLVFAVALANWRTTKITPDPIALKDARYRRYENRPRHHRSWMTA